MDDFKWCSFNSLLSSKPTLLKRDIVLNWFGGKDGFKIHHRQCLDDWKFLKDFLMDDE